MPKNRVMYLGLLVVISTILLWTATGFARPIHSFLPYLAGIGVAMLAGGGIYEWWRRRDPSRA